MDRSDTFCILMLGNSFTRANGLPELLAEELSCEVEVHARGGARLAEQLNPKTKLGSQTLASLEAGGYAFVVLQEMSTAAVASPASFERSRTNVAPFSSMAKPPLNLPTRSFGPCTDIGASAEGNAVSRRPIAR